MAGEGIVFRRGAAEVKADSAVELLVAGAVQPLALAFGPPKVGPAEYPGLGQGSSAVARAATAGLVHPATAGLLIQREVFTAREGNRLAVRLRLENRATEPVAVACLTPLCILGDGLRLGDTPAGKWVLLRQPRHKNDMPASLVLGAESPAVWDGVRGTVETGGWDRAAAPEQQYPSRFVSAELTVLRGRDSSLLLGALPLDRQLVRTSIELTPDRQRLARLCLDCEGDGQVLLPGAALESPWALIDLDPDPFAAIDRYVTALAAITPRRPVGLVRPRPTVWCSWYYYGASLTQEEAEANLAALASRPLPFDVFQIDECWDDHWGDWGTNPDWPDLAGLAQRVRQSGRTPGIWTCAFLAEPRSRLARRHPDWLLRRRNGAQVRFDMGGMANFVLDPTHPEVLVYLEEVYRRLTRELGFPYHKVDFTRAVVMEPDAVFHDPTRNRAQAYRMGIAAIRRGIGEDGYLNVCGGVYGPIIDLVDSQRSGSDVQSLWPTPPAGEEAHGYGPFTIKQNTLRYWWNDLWDNDPDALMVRRRAAPYRQESLSLGLMNDVEALTSTLNQYLGGGLVCFTENLTEVEDDRLYLLRHCSPSIGSAAVPRDAFEGTRFPAIFDTKVCPRASGLAPWHTVSVVNWHDEPREFRLILDRTLLGDWAESSDRFLVGAFCGGWHRVVARGEEVRVEPVPPHGCELLKVQPYQPDQPALIRTTGHFSMGGTEVSAWQVDQAGVHLQLDWPWPVPLEVVVLPPVGRGFTGTTTDAVVTRIITGPATAAALDLRYEE